MGWDGSGNVVRSDGSRTGANVWDQAKGAGIKIVSGGHDHHDEDLASSIENTVARDGQNSPTANLPMGGRKHTGVSDATDATDYAAWGQVQSLGIPFIVAANVGGTADAITLTPTAAITAYATGTTLYRFFVKTANTGAVTLAVSGLASVSIQRQNGTALASGDLSIGQHLIVVYDGAAFRSNVILETNHVLLTQAAYDALTPDSDTVYFSTG